MTEKTLKDVADAHSEKSAKLQAERIAGDISKEEFQRLEGIELRTFRKVVDTRMEHMGYSFLNKFRYITRSDAQKAVIDGITVAGITIGALFAIGNSKAVIDFFYKSKEQDEQSR